MTKLDSKRNLYILYYTRNVKSIKMPYIYFKPEIFSKKAKKVKANEVDFIKNN